MTEKKADYDYINKEALAADLLRWAHLRRQMDELEAAIKDTVLQLGETVVVGYTRATYRNPRKSYDYERAAQEWAKEAVGKSVTQQEADDLIAGASSVTVKIDWKGICDTLKLSAPYTESAPSVVIKMDGAPPTPDFAAF